ncbi:complement factor H-related protein 1-like [Cebidichthys violaceus]|uniref:complement factor H-related protein 1-like n=1 Tax=Cebidichthys violaceus TaxID=271503 RepID=UPI0035CBDA3D
MCVRRHLGFVLLLWFQGVLHVQTSDQPCSAPTLNDGYLVPEQDAYNHEAKLTYACDNGRKPAVEGWWATSTCQNGTWSPEPQCIDEKACIAPDIPNAIYTTNGWHEDGHKIRIACNEGYNPKDHIVTTTCNDGIWSSVPVCEKNINACGEPPQIPHAVIIFQGHQEVFAEYTKVQYECEDGYTVEGADDKKSVYCLTGTWTEGPVCIRRTRPGTGPDGSAVEGTDGEHTTTSPGRGPQSAGSRPGTGHAGSGGNDRSAVRNCGKRPVVQNGAIVEHNEMFLRYKCVNLYKLVGPEKVVCFSDGTWSRLPFCRENFCSVDTGRYPELINIGVKYVENGEAVRLACVQKPKWWTDHYFVGLCTHGKLDLSECCGGWNLYWNTC